MVGALRAALISRNAPGLVISAGHRQGEPVHSLSAAGAGPMTGRWAGQPETDLAGLIRR